MARPLKDSEEKRSVVFPIRLTKDENKRLIKLAGICGKQPSILVREKVFSGRFPEPRKARLEIDTYRELKKIGVNLNQLTKRANSGFLPPGLIMVLEHLARQQQEIIKILLNHDSQSKDR
ncbi:MobC family plasmid mobilization relaxosome protein [Mucilaginibacter terrae]|uniref:MobC family plasmid mobilization relaxosome protein n=1 Tax=Mucilaginibacter terrae TaxID=1955052 RepID=A0ABU3GVG1_9SPHI|nr:MobC family plasmid mobilization relaxosome protein [Mucilaginibacter terrae]MDT3403756.1 hypothetical protein [Mucilaginibacter terrae]